MTRLLAAAALGLGLLATATPAANACDAQHCPWSKPVCDTIGCPVYCTGNIPVANRNVCVLR
jgi:hypothetical protein